jgi:4'-phosphopantetheinyl transferase
MPQDNPLNYDSLLDAAHVWQLFNDDIHPADLRKNCWNWLSPDEKARNELFRTEELRVADLATRALCRATLSHYTNVNPADWVFRRGKYGKPKISAPAEFSKLRFNLAHTHGLVICLVSRAGEVGVDVEEMNREVDIESIAANFLSPEEYARIKSLSSTERAARFFSQWVLKEAYLKGRGLGLTGAPERFVVKTDENGSPLPMGKWQLNLNYPSAKYVAATAIRKPLGGGPIPIKWLDTGQLFKTRVAIER